MKRKLYLLALTFTLLFLAFVPGRPSISAQSGGTYVVAWHTIDDGGTMTASGGMYTLRGTIGQADAGTHGGGRHELSGGLR